MAITVASFGQNPLILLQFLENNTSPKENAFYSLFNSVFLGKRKTPDIFCCTEILYFFPLLTRNLTKKRVRRAMSANPKVCAKNMMATHREFNTI